MSFPHSWPPLWGEWLIKPFRWLIKSLSLLSAIYRAPACCTSIFKHSVSDIIAWLLKPHIAFHLFLLDWFYVTISATFSHSIFCQSTIPSWLCFLCWPFERQLVFGLASRTAEMWFDPTRHKLRVNKWWKQGNLFRLSEDISKNKHPWTKLFGWQQSKTNSSRWKTQIYKMSRVHVKAKQMHATHRHRNKQAASFICTIPVVVLNRDHQLGTVAPEGPLKP